jgi:8-oxo-dGTP diphosphatase
MIRRYGEPVDPARRYRLRPGVYAILPKGGDLLLTFQAEPRPEIQLPGGGIDRGEDPVRALHREVYEETGWHIAAPRRLGAYRRFTYMPEYDLWAEKLCQIWLATPTRRIGPPVEAGHTALWATPAEALRLIENDGERAFLRALLAG